MRVVVAVATIALLASGCARSQSIVSGDPVDHPYEGPMSIEPDFRDRATVFERSGAAGQALECTSDPFQGGGGNYDTGPEEIQGSPDDAVDNWIGEEGWLAQIPETGFKVERDDGDRVLYSYDVDDLTKLAIIAYEDVEGYDGKGWGVESWAICDPSEWPADVADELNYGVWEDAQGNRVPTSEVRSFQGAEFCSWEHITFLDVGPENDNDQYVRDVDRELRQLLRGTFDPTSALPRNAADSGYHRGGQELWLVPDRDAAYLVSLDDPNKVERWPASKEPFGCS